MSWKKDQGLLADDRGRVAWCSLGGKMVQRVAVSAL